MDLKDKIVVISGATGGIGKALAEMFSKEGSKLILVGRNKDKLQELQKNIDNSEIYVCDFADPRQITRVTEQIIKDFPIINVVVNCGGIGVYKDLEQVESKDLEDSFKINVEAPYFLSKGLLTALKQDENSRVINIGSGAGVMPMAGRSVYCATKFALRGMTLSLDEEYKGSSPSFTVITLGSTLTDFGPLSIEDKKEHQKQGKHYFTPERVARKIVGLLKANALDSEFVFYPSQYADETPSQN